MQVVKMKVSFFDTTPAGNSFAKFVAGQCYPQDAETLRRVAAGDAELVDAEPAEEQKAPELAPVAEVAAAPVEPAAQHAEPPAEPPAEQPAEQPAAPAATKTKAKAG